ncbi:unnamed protein product, partial [Brassica rapa]
STFFFHFHLLFIETLFISVSYHENIKGAKILFDFNFSLYCYFSFFSVNREPWPNQSRRRKRSLLVNQLQMSSSSEIFISSTLTLFSFQEL